MLLLVAQRRDDVDEITTRLPQRGAVQRRFSQDDHLGGSLLVLGGGHEDAEVLHQVPQVDASLSLHVVVQRAPLAGVRLGVGAAEATAAPPPTLALVCRAVVVMLLVPRSLRVLVGAAVALPLLGAGGGRRVGVVARRGRRGRHGPLRRCGGGGRRGGGDGGQASRRAADGRRHGDLQLAPVVRAGVRGQRDRRPTGLVAHGHHVDLLLCNRTRAWLSERRSEAQTDRYGVGAWTRTSASAPLPAAVTRERESSPRARVWWARQLFLHTRFNCSTFPHPPRNPTDSVRFLATGGILRVCEGLPSRGSRGT